MNDCSIYYLLKINRKGFQNHRHKFEVGDIYIWKRLPSFSGRIFNFFFASGEHVAMNRPRQCRLTLEGPPWIHFKNRMRMHLCVPVNLDTTRCIACTHVVTQSEAGQFDQFRTGLCENCWDGAFLCCLAEDAVFRLVQPSTGDESGLWIQSPVIIILDGKPLGLGFPCSEREFVTPYHMGAGPSRQIEPGETPTILVHGTYKQYIPSIQKRGLRCRRRDLHLQDPSEHAFRWRRDLEVSSW